MDKLQPPKRSRPQLGGGRPKVTGTYRSTCKACKHTITTLDPAVWSLDPIGLIHQSCAPGVDQ